VARLLGLGLLAVVLVTQVRWRDEVSVVRPGAEPERVAGTITRVRGGYEVRDESGRARTVSDEEVETRSFGGKAIPSVAYGFPTLVRRLSASVPTVALVLVALFVLAIVTAWRWSWLVHALGLTLSAADAIRYTLYGIFFNLVVPGATGGDVVKAYYAARRTGIATKAVVSVFVDRAVGLFALVLLAGAVLFLGPDREGYALPRTIVGVVMGGVLLFVTLVLSRRIRQALGLSALLRRLPFRHVWAEVDAAFHLYRRHPGSLGLGLLVSLGNHAASAGCAWLLARALGLEEVSLGAALAIVPVVTLLSAIPLLPGGWGVGEMAFAFFFAPLGVAPSEAVGWSVVYRLSVLVTGLPGGVLWLLARSHPGRAEMAAAVGEAEREAEGVTP
jgi:uncharacterized protein (TIRG00374 family)